MNAREFRAMADRCRALHRVAVRDEVREQLRQWTEDFDAEAEAIEKAADYSAVARARNKAA
jgi:hypothetical protein